MSSLYHYHDITNSLYIQVSLPFISNGFPYDLDLMKIISLFMVWHGKILRMISKIHHIYYILNKYVYDLIVGHSFNQYDIIMMNLLKLKKFV